MENADKRTIPDDGDRSDDKRFNETLIRMLKTPPKPKAPSKPKSEKGDSNE